MAKGNPRDPARERLWRRHLRQQRLSGLTVRDYCAQWRLAESAFHFWRREIAVRDRERRDDGMSANGTAPVQRCRRKAARGNARRKRSPAKPSFVPVHVVTARASSGSAIDIRLTSGHRLRVRAGCDAQLLAQVVALLEGRSC